MKKNLFSVALLVVTLILSFPAVSAYNYQEELTCLAKTMYFEARGSTKTHQYAIGLVVMNRMKDRRFPNTICEVIKRRGQFPWVKKNPNIRNKKVYQTIRVRAVWLYDEVLKRGKIPHNLQHLKDALFFGIESRQHRTHLGDINGHKFYR